MRQLLFADKPLSRLSWPPTGLQHLQLVEGAIETYDQSPELPLAVLMTSWWPAAAQACEQSSASAVSIPTVVEPHPQVIVS